MPFVSQAQRAKFYSDPKLRKYVPEYEAATPKGKLPEHVGNRNDELRAAAVKHIQKRGK